MEYPGLITCLISNCGRCVRAGRAALSELIVSSLSLAKIRTFLSPPCVVLETIATQTCPNPLGEQHQQQFPGVWAQLGTGFIITGFMADKAGMSLNNVSLG